MRKTAVVLATVAGVGLFGVTPVTATAGGLAEAGTARAAGVSGTGPMTAAGAQSAQAGIVAMGPAPGCVRGWVNRGLVTQTGHARNGCHRDLRVKILWAFGADSHCMSIRHDETAKHKIPIEPRRFDGVGTC
ncbi:hypothetical protein [Sinosporangium siamense]|uniref:Uncharacterized protein n=1 Tax=Sinosporangium siamense TaxID=1367973 RepID=A0A919VGT1_9ACTN|nr:hypothetical protein [Sinosporangium siamense]GII97414.1 hypothetical protein Ssi02_76450 [Sinosporangium siamense]